MEKKYKFTGETQEFSHDGKTVTLRRIKAVRDFRGIKKGAKGGWIESEANLSHDGDCWVDDEARVWGGAEVREDAIVRDNASVFGHAVVRGSAQIEDYVTVDGSATVRGSARVANYAQVSGWAEVGGGAEVNGQAIVTGGVEVMDNACVCGNTHLDGRIVVEGYAVLKDGISDGGVSVFGHVVVIG